MFLVTGATGNVGAVVVAPWSAAAQQVRALVRSEGRPLPAGVEAVTGDLNRPASLTDALAGVRGVFLLPGYEDMDGDPGPDARGGVDRVVLLSGSSAGRRRHEQRDLGLHAALGGRRAGGGAALDDPAALRVHVQRAALAPSCRRATWSRAVRRRRGRRRSTPPTSPRWPRARCSTPPTKGASTS